MEELTIGTDARVEAQLIDARSIVEAWVTLTFQNLVLTNDSIVAQHTTARFVKTRATVTTTLHTQDKTPYGATSSKSSFKSH